MNRISCIKGGGHEDIPAAAVLASGKAADVDTASPVLAFLEILRGIT
ncbi:hypothetical protein [Sphingomonas endophytica]|nr:hypothetical protein [Sphingomonas endophytica]